MLLHSIASKWHLPMAIAKVTIESPGSFLKTRSLSEPALR
jgi:hypothetical protein